MSERVNEQTSERANKLTSTSEPATKLANERTNERASERANEQSTRGGKWNGGVGGDKHVMKFGGGLIVIIILSNFNHE